MTGEVRRYACASSNAPIGPRGEHGWMQPDPIGGFVEFSELESMAARVTRLENSLDGVGKDRDHYAAQRNALKQLVESMGHAISLYLADKYRQKTYPHAEAFIEVCGDAIRDGLALVAAIPPTPRPDPIFSKPATPEE
jgi:hypothetical protein